MNAHNPTVIEATLTAAEWLKNATMTDSYVLTSKADREALRLWAAHCRREARRVEHEQTERVVGMVFGDGVAL